MHVSKRVPKRSAIIRTSTNYQFDLEKRIAMIFHINESVFCKKSRVRNGKMDLIKITISKCKTGSVGYCSIYQPTYALRWRHNKRDSVSNHQPHDCLLNSLFRRRSKKTSKLRVTGFCAGNSPGPANSPHKGPVTRKMFPFDDVIMGKYNGAYGNVWTHHDGVIKWKHFPRYWPFVWGIHR